MKNILVIAFSISTLIAVSIEAKEADPESSKPIAKVSPISPEEVKKGIENGTLCTDVNGLANSRGAVINLNGKWFRCVKVYGENLSENKKLVWVELTMKNGELVTAD